MGTNNHLGGAVGDSSQLNLASLTLDLAGKIRNPNPKWLQPLLKVNAVLVGEDFCWRHKCHLMTIGYGLRGG